jgi:hypothetical protein
MNECCCKTLSPEIVYEIEKNIGGKKLVYVITIDADGIDSPLAPEGVESSKLSQPIYTQKIIINSLAFCGLFKCCQTLPDDKLFSLLDELFPDKKQKIILAFDSDGEFTAFKNCLSDDEAFDFPMEKQSKSIAYGVFSGSCCYFYTTSDGHRVPIACFNPRNGICPPGWEHV